MTQHNNGNQIVGITTLTTLCTLLTTTTTTLHKTKDLIRGTEARYHIERNQCRIKAIGSESRASDANAVIL